MTSTTIDAVRLAELRAMALVRMGGAANPPPAPAQPVDALRALFELASSPATAGGALALLHELQVHQVELDLQAEELLRSRTELEAAHRRQLALYHTAPVGYLTLDADLGLHEVNQTAARMLESGPGVLHWRPLPHYLTPASQATLQAMVQRLQAGALTQTTDLELQQAAGPGIGVHAALTADPAGGGRMLLALLPSAPHSATGTLRCV